MTRSHRYLKQKKERRDEHIEEIISVVAELNPEAAYPTDMKSAIIGYARRFNNVQFALDLDKCIKILMSEGMTYEEAHEYFEFNTVGSWIGDESTPTFIKVMV